MNIKNMKRIGGGAQADVYVFEGKAIKIYKNNDSAVEARHEADLQKKAYDLGAPAPEVFDVVDINGKSAIIMELIEGDSLGEIILRDSANAYSLLADSVELQIKLHSMDAIGFPSQKEILTRNIVNNAFLSDERKRALLQLLDSFKTDVKLCHGDFHALNMVKSKNSLKIIDWVCANSGCATSDACRSYLLYYLYQPEIADMYLEIYCNMSGLYRNEALAWLPIVAGARLNEKVAESDIKTLLNMIP